MSRVLVTGGCGYIGSHTIVELLNNGFEVIAIDNLSNSRSACLRRVEQITGKKVTFYQCDLLDVTKLNAIFDENEIDAVIHFAASKYVGESMKEPLMYYKNNLSTTINLLETMISHKVYQFVFSSSAAVYGEPEVFPITESFPTGKVVNVYGRTKFFMEQLIQDVGIAVPDLNVISLRYFNPIGAHESGLIGEDNTQTYSNLFPLLGKIVNGEVENLKIFGTDYDTPDGTPVRDYIHILDLVGGHVVALKRLLKEHVKFKPYNLGLGEGLTVYDIIKHFEEASGQSIPCEVVGRREGDVPRLICDPTLANKELGWKTKRGVKEMCQDFWRWQSKNPNGFLGLEPLQPKEIVKSN